MEENSKTEESLEFEKGNVFKESYKQRDGFQKFWTKDKTEALLRILSAQAEVGEVHHGKVPKRKTILSMIVCHEFKVFKNSAESI